MNRPAWVAEGVETAAQESLIELGCTHLQGYYFGQPTAAATFHSIAAKPARFASRLRA